MRLGPGLPKVGYGPSPNSNAPQLRTPKRDIKKTHGGYRRFACVGLVRVIFEWPLRT